MHIPSAERVSAFPVRFRASVAVVLVLVGLPTGPLASKFDEAEHDEHEAAVASWPLGEDATPLGFDFHRAVVRLSRLS